MAYLPMHLILHSFFIHIVSQMDIQVHAISAQNEFSVQKRSSYLPHLVSPSRDMNYCWTHEELLSSFGELLGYLGHWVSSFVRSTWESSVSSQLHTVKHFVIQCHCNEYNSKLPYSEMGEVKDGLQGTELRIVFRLQLTVPHCSLTLSIA